MSDLAGDHGRASLLERAKAFHAEINQYFADVDYWNRSHTRFERIDPDPTGEVQSLLGMANHVITASKER